MLVREIEGYPEKKEESSYDGGDRRSYDLRNIGFNQALDLIGSLKINELDENKLLDLCHDFDVLCENCEGAGFVGYMNNHKKISCEKCGGHEDALGKGYIFEDLVQALITADNEGRLRK